MNRIGWLAIAALPVSVFACSGAPAPSGTLGQDLSGSSRDDGVEMHRGDGRDGGADLDDDDRDGAAEHEDAEHEDAEAHHEDAEAEHEDAEVHHDAGKDNDDPPGVEDRPDADADQGHGGGRGPH
jgi:hypothetical protein